MHSPCLHGDASHDCEPGETIGARATETHEYRCDAILYDGAIFGARMDRDPSAAATARLVAATLVDAAIPR
jgi:hypothetical protein